MVSAATAAAGESGGDGGDGGGGGAAGGDAGEGGDGGAGGVASVGSGDSGNEVGFVVGTGMDVMLTQRVSMGMEGLYYAFDNDEIDYVVGDDPVAGTDIENDALVVRARLTVHLP